MNILWIADFSTKHNLGGAQRSDEILIKHGRSMGHKITEFNYDCDPSILTAGDYEIVVSANLEAISNAYPKVLDFLERHPNHSRVEHDSNRYLSLTQRFRLFQSCKNTFFLTKYHHDFFVSEYGDFFLNVKIVPDPIDTNEFFDFKKNREEKTLYVGFMHELKGTYEFFQFVLDNPKKKFVLAGWGGPIFTHLASTMPNVCFLGKVEYEKMPELYNRYSEIFYTPRVREPFCRSIGEAALCGMKLVVNDKIGCIHELNRVGMEKFSQNCNSAADIFWKSL